ncbi:LAMI_0H17766g1_1 [Lachancea mirantina]|uniref:LAMI_0H17766g1_1 n=1 Tax=Lachancea mirantina TaxID=1230905 RepID=A0A1G4KJH7_9SACH|nr:LAMI_0H17766g1_1 [Lachancea mirantina]
MLNSEKLLTNLRRFRQTSGRLETSLWPIKRRAAVLVLLFIGSRGELRVLLTKRSRGLKSFSGHVSLPGGKADSETEMLEEMARRESEEEIGLPRDDKQLLGKYGMKIDKISTRMPFFLSRTFLSVNPMVCFLYSSQCNERDKYLKPLDGLRSFGKLNPGETSSIFSIPIIDLIAHGDKWKDYSPEYLNFTIANRRWGGLPWEVRHYFYPQDNMNDSKWLNDISDQSSCDDEHLGTPCKIVWGLTAKILHSLACIAVGEHSLNYGHNDLIYALYELGDQMKDTERSQWEVGMSNGGKGFKYKDVLPRYYHDALLQRGYAF